MAYINRALFLHVRISAYFHLLNIDEHFFFFFFFFFYKSRIFSVLNKGDQGFRLQSNKSSELIY
jgi:hypothetical protein